MALARLPLSPRSRAVRLVAAAVLGCSFVACSTPVRRLDPAVVRDARPKTLRLVLEPNDSFSGAPARPGSYQPVALGLLGIAVAVAATAQAERDFVRDAALEDPALAMGERLAKSLAANYGLSFEIFRRSRGVAEARPMTDLVLQLRTTIWAIEQGPTTWHRVALHNGNRSGLHYEVTARISDARSGRVLAEGTCDDHDPRLIAANHAPSSAEADALLSNVPTYHDMVALSGRLIVEGLEEAGDRCERKLRAEVLSLGPPPVAPQPSPADARPRVQPPVPSAAAAVAAPPAVPVKQEADDE